MKRKAFTDKRTWWVVVWEGRVQQVFRWRGEADCEADLQRSLYGKSATIARATLRVVPFPPKKRKRA